MFRICACKYRLRLSNRSRTPRGLFNGYRLSFWTLFTHSQIYLKLSAVTVNSLKVITEVWNVWKLNLTIGSIDCSNVYGSRLLETFRQLYLNKLNILLPTKSDSFWAKSPSVRIHSDTQKWWHYEKDSCIFTFHLTWLKMPSNYSWHSALMPSVTVIFHIQNKKKEHMKDKLYDVVQIFTERTIFIFVGAGCESCIQCDYCSPRFPGGIQEGSDGGRFIDHKWGEVRGHWLLRALCGDWYQCDGVS